MTLKRLRASRRRWRLREHNNWQKWHRAKSKAWAAAYKKLYVRANRKRKALDAKIADLTQAKSVSPAGVALIAGFEGGQSPDGLFHPYQDIAGVWTIGYGHTGNVSKRDKPLTAAAARRLLESDLELHYVPSVRALNIPMNQNQLDALVSFVYNVGMGALGTKYTIGRELRAKRYLAAADAMMDWNKARVNGVLRPVAGLTHRRSVERDLFLR